MVEPQDKVTRLSGASSTPALWPYSACSYITQVGCNSTPCPPGGAVGERARTALLLQLNSATQPVIFPTGPLTISRKETDRQRLVLDRPWLPLQSSGSAVGLAPAKRDGRVCVSLWPLRSRLGCSRRASPKGPGTSAHAQLFQQHWGHPADLLSAAGKQPRALPGGPAKVHGPSGLVKGGYCPCPRQIRGLWGTAAE